MDNETIKEVFDIIANMEVVKNSSSHPEFDENDPNSSIVDALNIVTGAIEDQQSDLNSLKSTNQDLTHSLRDVKRYQSALDISSIVSITDPEGKIIYVNDLFCELSGYSKKELIGSDHNIVKSNHHKRVFWNGLWQIISQGNIWQNEIMNANKEGISYWVNATIVPFFDNAGEIVNYLCMGHDITNRKIREADVEVQHLQLERINKNLEEFARTVSHDLKSPLNNAIGLIDVLEMTLGEERSEDVTQCLGMLRETNDKMRELIDGILKYSRARGGDMEMEEIKLKPFILDVGDTLTAKGETEINFNNNLPNITYNDIVLKQVLSNLMSNAIKFNDKEHCILNFSSSEDDRHYFISMEDNGPGVAKSLHKEMFKLFNSVNKNKDIDSTGVGLATVKKIVSEAGGDIWIDSELGEGAKFTFTVKKKQQNHW